MSTKSANKDSLQTSSKVILIICAITFGLLAGAIVYASVGSFLLALTVFILTPFVHLTVGPSAVEACEMLKQWAYEGRAERWTRDKRATVAATWPLSLVGCAILYLFLGIVHRTY